MLATIQMSQWASSAYLFQSSFVNFPSSENTQRIKEIAFAIFAKVSEWFKNFNNQSNEINIKAIAMISCISLIGLLVIALLRRRDPQSGFTPAPQPKGATL